MNKDIEQFQKIYGKAPPPGEGLHRWIMRRGSWLFRSEFDRTEKIILMLQDYFFLSQK